MLKAGSGPANPNWIRYFQIFRVPVTALLIKYMKMKKTSCAWSIGIALNISIQLVYSL